MGIMHTPSYGERYYLTHITSPRFPTFRFIVI